MADTVMKENDGEMAASDSTCHFLRIPKETRLEIYRYLLLPNPIIYMHPSISSARLHDSEVDSDDESSEDEWTDETDDDSELDSIMSEMMHDAERGTFSDDESSSTSTYSDEEDEEAYKRHLAILRTNRQIHSEALSIFYTEAVLTLEPGDIFCLAKKPRHLKFGWPNSSPWKHNPLEGVGKKDKNGVVVYDTPQSLGDIEPHIFARFQKISFDGYFDEEHTQAVELWIDDDTQVIKSEDAEEFKKKLRFSSLFRHLVRILRHSPRLNVLEITLEVEVMANSNSIMADMMAESDDDEEDEDSDVEDEVDKIMEIANQKATELFLDSRIMDPLLKLKNVSTCNFKFGFDHLDKENAYKPPAKYVEMLSDMKVKIESNFKEPKVAE